MLKFTFSVGVGLGGVGWGGVEWLDKLEIKPTQPHLKFGLELGLSLAILCK